MAARVLLLGILFTEVFQPLCTAGVRGIGNNLNDKNGKGEGLDLAQLKNQGLTLRVEPSNDVVLGKRGVTLNCFTGNNNNNNVSWLYNDEPAPPCGVIRCGLLDNGSLHFHKKQNLQLIQKSKGWNNTEASKKHVYRCIGRSNVGLLRSSPISVRIAELGHTFKNSPNDLTVVEGGIARFSCLIDSVPFPPNITWQHNGEPVLTDYNSTKYFTVPPGVLYISATKQSDAGSYRCIAINDFIKKTKKSKEAKLTVIPRNESNEPKSTGFLYPQITYNHWLLNGSNLKLICAAIGYPSPFITWSFVPQYPDGRNPVEFRILRNSTNGISVLTLKNVSISDAGTYLCSTKNSVTGGLEIQNITVDVAIPPIFIKKPADHTCPNGRTARFECQAQGIPSPQIYWLKDSENITINGRRTTYMKENNKMELAISATVPSDSGIYQCIAVNKAGEIWSAGRLQVNSSTNSPAAPTSLKCYAESPVKILISWIPPKSLPTTSITAYTVHYSPAEGGKEEVSPEPGNSTSVEVTKLLEPYTNYSFYVRVWNNHGASDQSASIVCATAPSVPKSALKVHIDTISSTKLNVTWEPLTKKEARGVIVEYKIQWRLHEHPSSRIMIVPANVKYYILSDLLPGGQYDLRVTAKTEVGWPNISESQLGWTSIVMPTVDADELSIKNILDIQIIILNASNLMMKWEEKLNNNDFTRLNFDLWQVYCENIDGAKILSEILPKNSTNYLFKNLQANVSYALGLCIVNEGESRDCVSKTIKSIYHDSETKPMALEALPLSPSSINLTWTLSSISPPSKFEICYFPVKFPSNSPKCRTTTATFLQITDLQPFTLYQFKVRPYSPNSSKTFPQQFTETIECYTSEDLPTKPLDLSFHRENSRIRLIWRPPEPQNGVITHYLVSFTSKSSEFWGNLSVPGNQTWALLPEFTASGRHYVTVQASTRAGYGISSDALLLENEIASKSPTSLNEEKPIKPKQDQSLGILLGVGISLAFIIISLCSIYCRKRWEHSRSLRNTNSMKNRVITRNGNAYCIENEASNSQNQQINCNDIELAVLCDSSNPVNGEADKPIVLGQNGIGEAKEPLLMPITWENTDIGENLHITENPQFFKDKNHSDRTSSKLSDADDERDGDLNATEFSMIDCTLGESSSSLNNNIDCSTSTMGKIIPIDLPILDPNG